MRSWNASWTGRFRCLSPRRSSRLGSMCRMRLVMMVENSERFGLAQLHQLRGPCRPWQERRRTAFFCTRLDGKQIRERLDILCKSNDGFEIANRDMQLRGPGDLFWCAAEWTAGLCAGGYLHRCGYPAAGK